MLDGSTVEKVQLSKEIFNMIDKLEMTDGFVVYKDQNYRLPVIPKDMRKDFIRKIHVDLCHLGMKKTKRYIQHHFTVPGLSKEVEDVIGECEECLRRKIPTEKTKEKLIPIKTDNFLDQLVMDIAYVGDKDSMYPYMLVIIDQFSKLVSLTEIRTQKEETVIECILVKWIYRFGKPKSILTDNGKCFSGSKFGEFCKEYGIKQIFSSPFQHQSNGLAERVIRTVRDMLVTSAAGTLGRAWWKSLPKIEFSINATVQSTTGHSPFEIVFNREINLHAAGGVTRQTDNAKLTESITRHTTEAANRMENLEGEKRGKRNFEIGQKVFVKVDPQKRRKDAYQFEGPFEIIRQISPHQLELKNMEDGRVIRRRVEWLKRVNNDYKREGKVMAVK